MTYCQNVKTALEAAGVYLSFRNQSMPDISCLTSTNLSYLSLTTKRNQAAVYMKARLVARSQLVGYFAFVIIMATIVLCLYRQMSLSGWQRAQFSTTLIREALKNPPQDNSHITDYFIN